MAKKSGRPLRSEKDIREMRSKIARVAQKLFREEGFDAVSIRRLAKEVGCAPMTIYAHFDTKTDILRHMWADVLDVLFQEIADNLATVAAPAERLKIAARTFVDYWLAHPEHFRLVFMSDDVSRSDVDTFLQDSQTLERFRFFGNLVQSAAPTDTDTKPKSDALVAGMIGIALSHITIRDYPWAPPHQITDTLVAGLLHR